MTADHSSCEGSGQIVEPRTSIDTNTAVRVRNPFTATRHALSSDEGHQHPMSHIILAEYDNECFLPHSGLHAATGEKTHVVMEPRRSVLSECNLMRVDEDLHRELEIVSLGITTKVWSAYD